jgi:hypothetical protein
MRREGVVMGWQITWTRNAGIDRRYLFVVLAFGAAAIWGGIHWLREGEITIRQGNRNQQAVAPSSEGKVAGRIPGEHVLFYPFCAAWIGLGITMVTLTIAAFIRRQERLDRLSFWSLAAVLPLGFLTVLAAILVKSG